MARPTRLVLAESARALGVAGILGIALLVFAAAFYFAALRPAHQARDAAVARVAATRLPDGTARPLPPPPQTPQDELRAFYAAFPGQRDASAWIDKLFEAAAAEGVALERGEYALTRDARTTLAQYRILLPVQGSYSKLRAFVARALADIPYLALDDIDVQRQSIGDGAVQVRLRMTLYLAER